MVIAAAGLRRKKRSERGERREKLGLQKKEGAEQVARLNDRTSGGPGVRDLSDSWSQRGDHMADTQFGRRHSVDFKFHFLLRQIWYKMRKKRQHFPK